jgi:transposase
MSKQMMRILKEEDKGGLKEKEVNGEQARSLFDSLLAMSRNGKLKGHETSEVAALYSVHVRTIQRSWNRGKACIDQGQPIDVSSRKRNSCGHKKKESDVSALSNVPIAERQMLEDASKHLNVSKSKLYRMLKKG